MSIQLEEQSLINPQQMEVAVNGPDGATYLILCTGIADLGSCSSETFTFFVGPQLSRRQFVGVIASGALSAIQANDQNPEDGCVNAEVGPNPILINAGYDPDAARVKVSAEVSSGVAMTKLAISYSVSILAELQIL